MSLVFRDREYPFAEDLIVDDSGAPDATLPVLAKVSSLIEVLRLGGYYELVYQLWSQFTWTASRTNVDVTWSRYEVLVGNFLFHVSTYPTISVFWCCVFSRSLWMVCTPASFLVCSGGWERMKYAALSLKSAAQRFGWWFGRGRDPRFAASVLRCWADSSPILHWRIRFWGKFWMLLVQTHLLSLCMEVCTFWQRLLQAIWELGIVPSSWRAPHLISGWWSVASSGLLRLCLGALTRSQWRTLWWTAWRAQRLGTGWHLVLHFERPPLVATSPCQA